MFNPLPQKAMRNRKLVKKITAFCIFLSILVVFSAVSSEALCINENKANLRKGPGTNYEKLWQVFRYMPFKELKKNGNWSRVQDVDGDIYWVHQKLITADFRCAVIKGNKTNLRKGPGTDYPKVAWAPVDKYFSMKVLQFQGDWVKIEDGVGDQAWIYKPLIWIQ